MQDFDTTIEKLKMLSKDNYIKAVTVINGLLNMQGEPVTENEDIDSLANDLSNKCFAAFARM